MSIIQWGELNRSTLMDEKCTRKGKDCPFCQREKTFREVNEHKTECYNCGACVFKFPENKSKGSA